MSEFDIYITLIFTIKVLFVLFAIFSIYYKHKGPKYEELEMEILYWKERLEFAFIFMMSALLIYLFSPSKKRYLEIDNETRLLLFLFGFVLLLTGSWGEFIKEAKWFKTFQKVIGNVGKR